MIKLAVDDYGRMKIERARRQFSGTVVGLDHLYATKRRRFVAVVTLSDVVDGQGRSFGRQHVPLTKTLEGIAVDDRIRFVATIALCREWTENDGYGPWRFDGGRDLSFRLTRPYLLGVHGSNLVPLRSAS